MIIKTNIKLRYIHHLAVKRVMMRVEPENISISPSVPAAAHNLVVIFLIALTLRIDESNTFCFSSEKRMSLLLMDPMIRSSPALRMEVAPLMGM